MKSQNPGWLLQLASVFDVPSHLELARRMRASSAWPARDKRKLETVANKLAQLDQSKDPEWWRKKGRVFVPALAEVLRLDAEDLLEKIAAEGTTPHSTSAWIFSSFAALRPVDLRDAELMPGLPAELVRDGGPKDQRTWWIAPPGAGKTLVGRWLEVRGWHHVTAATWDDAVGRFPEQGHVYIELTGAPAPSSSRSGPPRRGGRMCVAAIGPPPDRDDSPRGPELQDREDREPADAAAWTIVRSPPAIEWSRALFKWAAARAREGGGFDEGEVRAIFEKLDLWGFFETPGDLIGFLGMADEIGAVKLRESLHGSKDPLRLVRAWWKSASERVPDERRHPEVTKRGPSLLVEMTCERLRRGRPPRLSRRDWTSLITAPDAQPIDADEMLRALERHGGAAVRAKLLRTGEVLISGLIDVGVLHDDGHGALEIRPAWVARIVVGVAMDQLCKEGPSGMGALLLYPETAAPLLVALTEAVAGGDHDEVAACVEKSPTSAEELAALDGAFRAIGLALAAGVEVPVDLVERAWQRQQSCVAARYPRWPLVPVVSIASQRSGATAEGAWFIAALAITRKLTDERRGVASNLNPWAGFPDGDLGFLPDVLRHAASDLRDDHTRVGTVTLRTLPYRIGGQLFDRFGRLGDRGRAFEVQEPDLLIHLAGGAKLDLTEGEHERLLDLSWGLDVLAEACARRGVAIDDVLRWCWTWWGLGSSEPPRWDRTDGTRERLWRLAPAGALSDRFLAYITDAPEIWPWLSDAVWERWQERWDPEVHEPRTAGLFAHVPERLAVAAIRSGKVNAWASEIREVLWRRIPEALLALIEELARAPSAESPHGRGGPMSHLVYATPDQRCEDMVARAARWLEAPAEFPGAGAWVTRWLMHVIERRSPGWRRAVELVRAR